MKVFSINNNGLNLVFAASSNNGVVKIEEQAIFDKVFLATEDSDGSKLLIFLCSFPRTNAKLVSINSFITFIAFIVVAGLG